MQGKPSVERVWRRDGSVNVMDLEVAADNVKQNASDPALRAMTPASIEVLLMHGQILSTGQASFRRSSK